MRKLVRALATALTVAAVVPFFGCGWLQSITVVISDFDSNDIQGVWVWREDVADGSYQRETEIRLEEPFMDSGQQFLRYSVRTPAGEQQLNIRTPIVRPNAGNPDAAQLTFFIVLSNGQAGSFKASTYNDAGESTLSTQTLDLDV